MAKPEEEHTEEIPPLEETLFLGGMGSGWAEFGIAPKKP